VAQVANDGTATLECKGDFSEGGQLDCTIHDLVTVPGTTTPPPTTTTIPTSTTTPPPKDVAFFEDFTGDDIADFTSRFDWEVVDLNRRDVGWPGHHDMQCNNPDTTRTLHHYWPISNTDPQDEFWLCGPPNTPNDHIMTANGENGTFGITAFSPKLAFAGKRVCWSNNLTLSAGRRHWFEVQLIDAARVANEKLLAQGGGTGEGMVGRVDYERGTARLAWGHGMDGTFMKRPWPADSLVFDYTDELVRIWKGQSSRFLSPWVERFAPTDKATRYQTCLVDNGNNTVTFTQQRPAGGPGTANGGTTYTRTVSEASFPASYRVIFSAQNYNAGKDGTQPHQTWHWDNILVAAK
jgi:hypothetical protein